MANRNRINGLVIGDLGAIETLRDGTIAASISELRARDRLTLALREALSLGADINDLSEASGLTVSEIRRRIEQELSVLTDTEALAGAV